MARNCNATNGAGRSIAPTHSQVRSADCWSDTSICSPSSVPSSISLASGSPYENDHEARSTPILVFVERNHDGGICTISLESLSIARDIADHLNRHLYTVIIGSDLRAACEELQHYGIDKIYVADNIACSDTQPESIANVLAGIIEDIQPRLVVMGDTILSQDIAPRVAFTLNASLATACSNIYIDTHSTAQQQVVFTRQVYSGHVMAEYTSESTIAMATMRSKAFMPAKRMTSVIGNNITVEVNINPEVSLTTIREVVDDEEDNSLDQAEVVISGGRGVSNSEGFSLLNDLAAVLGGVVGSSRPPVDYGWMPTTSLIGQTGKTIAPKLYIAVGISGAIQHLMGMASSKIIVAINKSEDANIFDVAHYGIIGDYAKIVPVLIETIKKLKHSEGIL